LVHASALTFSCFIGIATYTQTANAESCGDPGVECLDGVVVIGNPPYTDPFNDFDPLFPDDPCQFDCGNGNGGGDGGGSNNNPNAQECLDLFQERPSQCAFDPVGPTQYNWNGQGLSLYNIRNNFNALPAVGWPSSYAPLSIYQNFVSEIATTYWGYQNQTAVNQTYWNEIHEYCRTFPVDGGFFVYDRTACYVRAYRTSLLFLPTYSDSAYTISQIQAFGITVEHHAGENPLGNWGANFYNHVNNVKECKLWHDRKEQLGGCN